MSSLGKWSPSISNSESSKWLSGVTDSESSGSDYDIHEGKVYILVMIVTIPVIDLQVICEGEGVLVSSFESSLSVTLHAVYILEMIVNIPVYIL